MRWGPMMLIPLISLGYSRLCLVDAGFLSCIVSQLYRVHVLFASVLAGAWQHLFAILQSPFLRSSSEFSYRGQDLTP